MIFQKLTLLMILAILLLVGCEDKEKQKLENQVASLSSKLEAVQGELENAQSEFDTLKSEIDELSSDVDSFSYSDWRDAVASVQYSMPEVESAADDLETAIQQAIDAAN